MFFYNLVKVLGNIIFKVLYRFEVTGKDNIPTEGRIIICANHSSLLDPIVLAIICPRPISFMAKKELFKSKTLSYILNKLNAFPVDRHDSDLTAIKTALRVLKNNEILGIFPEGTRVKEIDLNNAKPGIALLSVKSQSSILPVYIQSNYKIFNKIKITFGEPIDFSDSYKKKLTTEEYRVLSQDILKSIYSLKSK